MSHTNEANGGGGGAQGGSQCVRPAQLQANFQVSIAMSCSKKSVDRTAGRLTSLRHPKPGFWSLEKWGESGKWGAMGGNGRKWGAMGGNGGQWGEMGPACACACACACVSPIAEGGGLPAPLAFSLSVRPDLRTHALLVGP